MAKFKTGLSVKDAGKAEGYQVWDGELPPSGSYTGVLKVFSLSKITSTENGNEGKDKAFIGVELRDTPGHRYDGYVVGGNLNFIEGSEAYVNQFLYALTDGTEAQYSSIKKAFDAGFDVDERKKHVLKIGRWNVNSPKGELPIKVSISNKPFYNERTKVTTNNVRIESYLLSDDSVGVNGSAPDDVVEDEEPAVVIAEEDEDGDEDLLD